MAELRFVLPVWAFGIWVGSAAVAAWVAWEKGREPVGWLVLALFLSPLVALVALSAVPAHHMARRRAWRARPDRKRPADPVIASTRRANGAKSEDKRWDVVTSAAMTTKRPW